MVRTQVAASSSPFQTKRSFMIEDLLRIESCATESSSNSTSDCRSQLPVPAKSADAAGKLC